MEYVKYKKGYKYQIVESYRMYVGICPKENISTEYIDLSIYGILTIRKGYCYDGPSGPTIDTKNFMRGALEHDAIYQLMRMSKLDYSYRIKADARLYDVCREDGMWYARAQWVYYGVRAGGKSSAKPESLKKIYTAP